MSASKIVAVAKGELGVKESGGGYLKYTNGRREQWCADFVSWCAKKADVPESVITRSADCDTIKRGFGSRYKKSHAYGGEKYEPKAGDIIFFSSRRTQRDATHIGIVTGASNGKVYTIEGNSSDAVRANSYANIYASKYIIGYGVPAYQDSTTDDEKKEEKSTYEVYEDTGYTPTSAEINNEYFPTETIKVFIESGGKICEARVLEGVTWETQLQGTPGRCEFKVLPDNNLSFTEGNAVKVVSTGTRERGIFRGYVFTKKRSKENIISVICYDQLRYLKNKDSYTFKDMTASEIIHSIARDFNLKCGIVEKTGVKFVRRIEFNKTLFDMMQTAINLTVSASGRLYVLYDDFGKLSLRNIESMRINLMVDKESAEDFDYESSIDKDTYNRIKLIYKDKDKKSAGETIIKDEDPDTIKSWGVLQYFEQTDSLTQGKEMVSKMLEYYNKKARRLEIKGVFGDMRVRAGTRLAVKLAVGDIMVSNLMIVTQAKHTFENNRHVMDLTVKGGMING